jgi:uncharacterized protein YfbU (UPF0304 family)
VKLTNPEKLILVMLSEIHEALKIQNGVDTKLLKSAIYSDNTWALPWEMSGILRSEGNQPPDVKEVLDILDMWTFLEEAYDRFGPQDRKKVEAGAAPFGTTVAFVGFDGNNETRLMGIAQFLVDDMGRFQRFKGRDMNSHMPSIDTYRRMLAAFDPIRATLDGDPLTADQIIPILKAKKHPSQP